jgi:hypothetical protein
MKHIMQTAEQLSEDGVLCLSQEVTIHLQSKLAQVSYVISMDDGPAFRSENGYEDALRKLKEHYASKKEELRTVVRGPIDGPGDPRFHNRALCGQNAQQREEDFTGGSADGGLPEALPLPKQIRKNR